jgi:hypothetical protein
MRRLRALAPVALSIVLVGCGGKSGGSAGAPARDKLASCVERGGSSVSSIPTGPAARGWKNGAIGEQRIAAMASEGVSIVGGGPSNSGGRITEAPQVTDDLLVFSSPATAAAVARAEARLLARQQATIRRQTPAGEAVESFTIAEPIGRAVLIHSSGGLGAAPGVSSEFVGTLRDCLARAGYA